MNTLKRLLATKLLILITIGISSCSNDCACETPVSGESGFSGVWKTSYGDVYFPKFEGKTVRGAFWSYPESNGKADNGRILAEIDGASLTGYWVEDSGNTPCATERDGSLNWGPVHFEANADFSVISGAWGFCDQQPEGDDAGWVGIRD